MSNCDALTTCRECLGPWRTPAKLIISRPGANSPKTFCPAGRTPGGALNEPHPLAKRGAARRGARKQCFSRALALS
eukprot:8906926-Pyramimonas_sp.AAC.1